MDFQGQISSLSYLPVRKPFWFWFCCFVLGFFWLLGFYLFGFCFVLFFSPWTTALQTKSDKGSNSDLEMCAFPFPRWGLPRAGREQAAPTWLSLSWAPPEEGQWGTLCHSCQLGGRRRSPGGEGISGQTPATAQRYRGRQLPATFVGSLEVLLCLEKC